MDPRACTFPSFACWRGRAIRRPYEYGPFRGQVENIIAADGSCQAAIIDQMTGDFAEIEVDAYSREVVTTTSLHQSFVHGEYTGGSPVPANSRRRPARWPGPVDSSARPPRRATSGRAGGCQASPGQAGWSRMARRCMTCRKWADGSPRKW